MKIYSTHLAAHLLVNDVLRMNWPPHLTASIEIQPMRLCETLHYAAEDSGNYKTIFSLGWHRVRNAVWTQIR